MGKTFGGLFARPGRSGRARRLALTSAAAVLLATVGVSAAMSEAATDNWTTYLFSNARTGFNRDESVINQTNAGRLRTLWTAHASGPVSAQPVVADGLIYWGAWDGFERATDTSGRLVWSTNLGTTTGCGFGTPTSTAGVAGAPAVAHNITVAGRRRSSVLFVGGGKGQIVALEASNGAILWQTPLGTATGDFVWSSPAYYRGSVYVGLSSFNDCPLVQGKVLKLDANSGGVQSTFDTVPNGCAGASVWGSASIDDAAGRVYVGTGNLDPNTCSSGPTYDDAVLELDASDLSLVDSWKLPASTRQADSDFGSTPTLFKPGRALVGLPNKDGNYYAFQRDNLHNGPIWPRTIAHYGEAPEFGVGSIAPSAFDGNNLYVGGGNTTINGTYCPGSLRALNPRNGSIRWQLCLNGAVLGAISAVPGIVAASSYTFSGGQVVTLANASTGAVLGQYLSSSFYGAPTIANGVLYIGDVSGTLYALAP